MINQDGENKRTLPIAVLLSILIWISLFMTGCTRYDANSMQILDDLSVNYEVVEEVPHYPKAEAVYVHNEDKIYVKKGKAQMYLILHELVHKIRVDADVYTNHKLEEIIAVKSAYIIGQKARLQIGVGKYELPSIISRTLGANELDRGPISDGEKMIVEREIERTVQLFIDLLAEKGYNMRQVDWAKTALLILL